MTTPKPPRPTVLLLLTLMVVVSLIAWLDLTFNPTYTTSAQTWLPSLAARSDLLGLLVFAGLLVAYWYGWEAVRVAAVVGITLLVGLTTPDPFVRHYGAMGVFLPPVVALVLTNSSGVLLSTVAVLGIFIARAGGQGVYTQPLALAIIAGVVGGMLLSRGLLHRTQRQLAAQAVELEQQRDAVQFQAHLLDVVQHAVVATDLAGTIIFWNRFAETLYGWTAAEAVGQPIAELLRTTTDPHDRSAAAGGWHTTDSGRELLLHRRDGVRVPIWRTTTPLSDEQGALVGTVDVAIDSTARKQAEAVLRASEQRYRTIVETAQEGIWIMDTRATTSYVNHRMAELLGYTVAEMLHQPIVAFLDADARREALQLTRHAPAQPGQHDFRFRRKDGSAVWGLISTSPVRNGAGHITGTLTMITDITERKRAEAALRESEQLHRLIAEHTHDLISLLDADGRFRYVSPSYAAVLGYDPPTLLDRSPRELLHPDDAARAPEAWQQLTTQGRHRSLIRFRHASGTWRWCEVSDATFVRDGLLSVASVARDVTEAKQLEAQLRQSQKMEAIGRLAGGVAHDFNNLLTAISGYIDLALRDTALSVQLRADLHVITQATERAARLTSQLLAFARKQIIDPQLVDLNDLLRAMERLLRPLLGADVALLLCLTPDLPAITADPGQIEQIVVNLAVNARDAMPQGGTLRIETARIVLDDDAARKQGGVRPGRYVQLAVSDTGSGMSAEVQAHIFEPFFTTKEPGKGTGLGLATCYGIVEQHGGHIAVASAVGHGTTISISFPALAAPVAAAQSPHAAASPLPGGSETVLLIEDEAAVRTLAVRVLTAQGYTVLEAGNGVEALRVAQAYDGTIDLVVTDVVMLQLGGPALIEQLVPPRPGIKVIFISGYNDDTVITQGRREHTIVFLQKPFSLDALLRTIREVLDGATQQIILGE